MIGFKNLILMQGVRRSQYIGAGAIGGVSKREENEICSWLLMNREFADRERLIYSESGRHDPYEMKEHNPGTAQKELMNAKETAEYLGIAKGTI